MPYICELCDTEFSKERDFRRHTMKKIPCRVPRADQIESTRCIHCDKVYSRVDSLHRHQKACKQAHLENVQKQLDQLKKLSSTLQTINITVNQNKTLVNQTQTNTVNVQTAENTAAPAATRMPGWPAKWPVPSKVPRPFLPPSFTITPKMLEQAFKNVGNPDGCQRGDLECIAKLGVECFKLLHQDPEERNIYLNPSRADQSIVFTRPAQWEALPLHDALHTNFDHLIKEMTGISTVMPQRIQETTQAATDVFRSKPRRVVKCASPGVSAHLGNLVMQLLEPPQTKDSWIGKCIPFEISDLSWFCRESKRHLPGATTALTFETALGVSFVTDVTAEKIPIFAAQLPVIYARMLLSKHPENLTVIINEDTGCVFVNMPEGWVPMPARTAAIKQFRSFAEMVVAYIRAYSNYYGTSLLDSVATYLENNLDEIAAYESANLALLTRYASEAERYYRAVTGMSLEVPRRLLGTPTVPVGWTDAEIEDLIENWVLAN